MGWQFVLVSVSAARQRSQVLDNVYLASALGLDLEGSDHDKLRYWLFDWLYL